MNPKILPATVTAVVGFALGWAVKPAASTAASDAAAAAAANAAGAKDGSLNRPDRPPLVLPTRASQRPAEDADGNKRVDINRTWREIVGDAEKSRMLRLSEAMGLNEEQQAQVAAIRKKEHDGFRDLTHSGKSPAELMEQAAAAQAEADEAMKKVLDPVQLASLESYKARQKDNDIEAKAQSVLGDVMANADLDATQRESVLALLRSTSAKDYESQPAGWELMSENYSILGTKNTGLIDNLGSAFTSGGPTDPAAMQQKIQEAQRQTAQVRIAQLTGILTPAQLTQYRTALEGRVNLSKSVPALPPSR
jgi:hypothetical protein